ncbi:MAG: sugar ABC transporter permease [Eubacteriales bacterium]
MFKIKKRTLIGYIFLLPFVLHFILFVVYPLFRTLSYSLTDFTLLTMKNNFVGLKNYQKLFSDDVFIKALKNTAYYVLIDGTGVVVFGLLMALVLNLKRKGIGIFRTIYYLPVVVDWVIVSIVFMFIFEPNFGVANYVLKLLGMQSQQFLQSPTQALPLITFASIWKGVGYYAIFYLAALQDVPEMLMEAASIGSLKGFNQFYIMTSGGPVRSTTTIMLYFYEQAFAYTNIGYGSAIAMIFTIFVLFFVLLQKLLLSRLKGASGNN